ncbi:MAG: LemA family protein, partial [Patescibacteria group bacterium]
FYNSNVLDFNTKVQMFPSNLIANAFAFKPFEFFEAEEADKQSVKVKFD